METEQAKTADALFAEMVKIRDECAKHGYATGRINDAQMRRMEDDLIRVKVRYIDVKRCIAAGAAQEERDE